MQVRWGSINNHKSWIFYWHDDQYQMNTQRKSFLLFSIVLWSSMRYGVQNVSVWIFLEHLTSTAITYTTTTTATDLLHHISLLQGCNRRYIYKHDNLTRRIQLALIIENTTVILVTTCQLIHTQIISNYLFKPIIIQDAQIFSFLIIVNH